MTTETLPRATPPRTLTQRRTITPPEYARQLGVDRAKIMRWIRSGELPAFNAAATTNSQPRYLIRLEDIAIFEQRRTAAPQPKPPRRKNRMAGEKRYF